MSETGRPPKYKCPPRTIAPTAPTQLLQSASAGAGRLELLSGVSTPSGAITPSPSRSAPGPPMP